MLRSCCAFVLAFVSIATARGQAPAQPPTPVPNTAQPESQFPALKVEKFDPALSGDEFEDDEWGMSIRPPKGLIALDPVTMARIRQAMIPPEDKRRLPSGTVQKMQVHKFEDPRGATLLVELFDPPLNINSPTELRAAILERFARQPVKLDPNGKLLQFKSRGNRVGFFCEFDVSANGLVPSHQYVAVLRAGSRSAVLTLTAPQSVFADYVTPFQQSITQLSLRDAGQKMMQSPRIEPTRFEGMRNTLTILGNIALIAVVSLGIWRASRAS